MAPILALLCCCLCLVAFRADCLQVALVVIPALVYRRDVINLCCECDMPSCLARLAQACITPQDALTQLLPPVAADLA